MNRLRVGDLVVHTSRPEWGEGRIERADPLTGGGEGGMTHQKLHIRFDRVGLKALSTEHARLEPVLDPDGAASAASASAADRPRVAIELNEEMVEEARRRLTELPSAASDKDLGCKDRLAATLRLYRFDGDGWRDVLNWAAVHSGLVDPLAAFTRADIELLSERFRARRDAHLDRLIRELLRTDPASAVAAIGEAPPGAQHVAKQAAARALRGGG